MFARYSLISLAALSLTAIGMTALPVNAYAQDEDPAATGAKVDPSTKKITLELESTNLYYALKLLFAQIKANYVLEESLKSLTVTAHLTNVPFRVALETLLKSTNVPLTYTVDNGIYNIKPKVEDTTAPTQEDTTKPNEPGLRGDGSRIQKIHSTSLSFNAIDIVQALGGKVLTVGQGTGQFGRGGLGGGQGGGGLGNGFGGGGLGGFGGGQGGGFGGGGLGGFGGGGLGGGGFGGGRGGGGFGGGGGGRGGF